MSAIINLNMVCLVCLKADCGLRSVFEHDEGTPELSTIAEKIARCSDLKLLQSENDGLPHKICQFCMSDLEIAWKFRQNCDLANSVIHSIQMQVKEEETLASFELAEQKIVLPSCLKIKRVQPETQTFFVPVEVKQQTDNPTQYYEVQAFDYEEHNDADQGNEIIADYYEVEDILDDNSVVEIETETIEPDKNIEAFQTNDIVERPLVESEKVTPSLKVTRRGRGRPKRTPHTVYTATKPKGDTSTATKTTCDTSTATKTAGYTSTATKTPGDTSTATKATGIISTAPTKTKPCGTKSTDKDKGDIFPKPATVVNAEGTVKKQRLRRKFNQLHTDKCKSEDTRPPKICEICGNSYKFQHALNAHMRRHTNDRPYACEFCTKKFVSGVELRRHMRVHTGMKPYQCHYCERRFSDFGSRIKHERTHTGERPYNCDTCHKSFAYAHVLSVHIRTHTGEKKFKCKRCGKGFTKKAYLTSHVSQTGHNDISTNMKPLKGDKLMSGDMNQCMFTNEEYIIEERDEDEFDEHDGIHSIDVIELMNEDQFDSTAEPHYI